MCLGSNGAALHVRITGGEFVIQKSVSCNILFLSYLSALHVVDMRRTRVFCGPIAGSLMVERCQECVFAFAARQVWTCVLCAVSLLISIG